MTLRYDVYKKFYIADEELMHNFRCACLSIWNNVIAFYLGISQRSMIYIHSTLFDADALIFQMFTMHLIIENDRRYETLFAEAETLFDELRSLRDFYRHFLSAYLQVGPELERQCQYNSTVTRLVCSQVSLSQVPFMVILMVIRLKIQS